MKLKTNLFKSTDKFSLKKKMWHSLKKHIGLLTNIVADSSIILQLSKLSLIPNNNLSTDSVGLGKQLRLAIVYSGVSKHLTNPMMKKGIIGEDAFFVAAQKNCDVIGVADGVGGWSSVGIDPSVFSSNLMKQCKKIVEKENFFAKEKRENEAINISGPVKLLEKAFENLKQQKDDGLVGSATACIMLFDYTTNNLISANLGDSGFVVVRDQEIVHRSVEQQHYFNCPYQLAIYPGHVKDVQQDRPDSAFVSSFRLIEGDIICLATDGLWDNLSDSELLVLLNKKIQNFSDLSEVATKIVETTVRLSLDSSHMSPFALSARQNQLDFAGGKPDDITVLLARVTY